MNIEKIQNETIKTLITRRSIRKYKKEQVPDEILDQILEAGKYSASGKNLQPTVMIAIQNPEIIAKLSKINAECMGDKNSDPFYGAPTVIAVLADKSVTNTYLEDGAIVIDNLMNAAHALDIDSCYINRAREEFETEYGKTLLEELGIKGDFVGIGHCVLGYRDCKYPEAYKRKENFVYRIK